MGHVDPQHYGIGLLGARGGPALFGHARLDGEYIERRRGNKEMQGVRAGDDFKPVDFFNSRYEPLLDFALGVENPEITLLLGGAVKRSQFFYSAPGVIVFI